MNTWIDFKELRARLDFEQVLRRYNVEVKRKGSQHHGFCPLPNHKGKRNSPSFSANLERGVFHCFGCGATGNILEFAALMENANPEDGTALRKVALKLKNEFCPHLGTNSTGTKKSVVKSPPSKSSELPVVVNQPLDFELKGLDRNHPYLGTRGFTKETIAHFGLGYCARGIFKERVAIPLHDAAGKLIGYCGRVVDDAAISEENPRYRFPSKRERDGRVFEFRKQAFIYNGFRFKTPLDDLIVVEGFTSVWWLHQNGLPRVVAVMAQPALSTTGTSSNADLPPADLHNVVLVHPTIQSLQDLGSILTELNTVLPTDNDQDLSYLESLASILSSSASAGAPALSCQWASNINDAVNLAPESAEIVVFPSTQPFVLSSFDPKDKNIILRCLDGVVISSPETLDEGNTLQAKNIADILAALSAAGYSASDLARLWPVVPAQSQSTAQNTSN